MDHSSHLVDSDLTLCSTRQLRIIEKEPINYFEKSYKLCSVGLELSNILSYNIDLNLKILKDDSACPGACQVIQW